MAVEKNMGKVRWTDEQLEARVQEIIASAGGGGGTELLWENPDDTLSFAYQIITLAKPITNYKFYEVLARFQNNSHQMVSSGKSVVERSIFAQGLVIGKGIGLRRFTPIYQDDPLKMYVNDCYVYASLTSTSSTKDNTRYIPYMILGYK